MNETETPKQPMPVREYGPLREILLDILKPDFERAAVDVATLDDEENLLGLGVIDSFGILVMITDFEKRTGIKIDLEQMDPFAVTSIKGFVTGALELAE